MLERPKKNGGYYLTCPVCSGCLCDYDCLGVPCECSYSEEYRDSGMDESLTFRNIDGHSGNSTKVHLTIDKSGYLELEDKEMDWVCAYANLSKEQMAEVGRFLLEAALE